MNLLGKPTRQGRHGTAEYVLLTVSVPFPGDNFGMCPEHKTIPALFAESEVEKIA